VENKVTSLSKRYPQRRDTLKCQMSFGWDFAPPLLTMGIWDDVVLVVSGEAFIRDVVTRQQHDEDEVTLRVGIELDARQARPVRLRCVLIGETFESKPLEIEQIVELQPGASRHNVDLTVLQPHLWWPWDHGPSDLYHLTVEVWDGGELLDAQVQTVGLRQVELDDWNLHVNGRRVYARGANWVPANILPGRVTEADYRQLLTLAREANMNMLRVWGGGLREKRAFYDLCDRLGILVWQEFPFACAFLTRYPRSMEYLRVVETEARAIIHDLRNHACLALWCGGNEFDAERNQPLVNTLRRTVEAEDPTRPFLSSSPANGDSHNWQVWHNFQPPSAYRQDEALFASEFGLQAPSDVETLRRFIPPEELWPPGPSWMYHGAGLAKLWRYARPYLGDSEPTLEAFVLASQRAQAHGLQVAIEHYRRRKSSGLEEGCGGVLLWQLNEPWPAISWALVDFYRQPKLAYGVVKRLFSPLLVSLDYAPQRYQSGDEFRADVWIVNDRAEGLPGCRLEVELKDGADQPVHRLDCAVDIAADSAEILDTVCWELPADGGWQLDCRITQNGQIVTQNQYDLTVHDGIQPTLGQRVWAWLSRLVLPS
jgi:beta-mannosidase